MSVINQCHQIDINQVFIDGKISFGQSLYNGFTFSEKSQGANFNYGFHSPINIISHNKKIDNDFLDQGDLWNEQNAFFNSK